MLKQAEDYLYEIFNATLLDLFKNDALLQAIEENAQDGCILDQTLMDVYYDVKAGLADLKNLGLS